jgi:hypothetical protein
MGRYNPKQVFPINTYGHHESRNENNHEPPTHLGLRLIRCCAVKTFSSRSSTCICDQESRSLKPSSSSILHWESRSSQLLARFFKFFTTARLPIRRTRAEGRRLHRELHQTDRRLHPTIVVRNRKSRTSSSHKLCLTYSISEIDLVNLG